MEAIFIDYKNATSAHFWCLFTVTIESAYVMLVLPFSKFTLKLFNHIGIKFIC